MNSSLGVIDPLTSGYIDLSFSFHTQLSNTTEWVLRMEETVFIFRDPTVYWRKSMITVIIILILIKYVLSSGSVGSF